MNVVNIGDGMGKNRVWLIVGTIVLVLILTIVGVVAIVTSNKADRPLTVAELLDLGEKYLRDLEYEQALVQFEKVIEIEPMNPRGYTGAAEAFIGLGEMDKAIEVLEKGFTLLPDNESIRLMLDEIIVPKETMIQTLLPAKDLLPEQDQNYEPADDLLGYINIQTLSTNAWASHVITDDGWLWAWGNNEFGKIGNDSTDYSYNPIRILDSVVSVSVSGNSVMAIKEDGSLWEWGTGTISGSYKPVKIMDSVVSVSSGYGSVKVIKSDGSLWAWGNNEHGQLGDGTTNDSYSPIKIMDSVVSVSLGYGSVKVIKSDGSLWAWGNNEYGQLGDGTTNDSYSPIKIMDSVVSVSSGYGSVMAIKSDGSLWAWGNNKNGRIGDGTTENRYNPVNIMDSVVFISANGLSPKAVQVDGSLWSWGGDDHMWSGFVGDGTTEVRLTPVLILESVIFATDSKAIMSDGSLWSWGFNYHGTVGDGTRDDFRSPNVTPVKIMDSVVFVVEHVTHCYAIKTDGTLWVWGWNFRGKLGSGSQDEYHLFPVKVMENVRLP